MTTVSERLEAATAMAEEASEIARQWANGPENTTIPTESGPLPTLAEFLRANASLINRNIPHLKELPTAQNAKTDIVYIVIGFHQNTIYGGGGFVWQPAKLKSLHNGGTVIAPEALAAWDGTKAGVYDLLNWSGTGSGCWVRTDLKGLVSPEMFGAEPYSTIQAAAAGWDQTVCLDKAQRVGPVWVAGIYPVKNFTVTDGCRLIGPASHLARSYDTFKSDAPMLCAHSSSVAADKVIRCRNKKHWYVNGVNFDGRNLCGVIEGGAFRPTLVNVGIRGANGDNLGDNLTPYTRGLHALNLVIREASNDNIANLVDSYIDTAFVSDAGRHNINLGSGSNSNVFSGGKVEWSGQHNINIYQSNNISFSGTILDRAGYNALRIQQSQHITGNVIMARSGKYAADPVSGKLDCHLVIQSCDSVNLSVVTKKYGDDGGVGYESPRYSVSATNNSRNCVLYGDLSGCTTRANYENSLSINTASCVGSKFRPIGGYKAVTAGATVGFELNGFTINTFENYVFDLTVSAVDTTTAQENMAAFKVFIVRAGGLSYVKAIERYISTSGERINSSGSPLLLVSAVTNNDSSAITVNITSSSLNTNNVRVTGDFGSQLY